MSTTKRVRFELFGPFKIIVDGQEVQVPEATFLTYLKLFLLSGEASLPNGRSCPLGDTSKVIRDVVDKGNSPRKAFQGGRYAFTELTGLALKYREGFGLELQGDDWTSDLWEFEELWRNCAGLTSAQLQTGLELYGEGVPIRTWRRDRTVVDCEEWIHARLVVLETRQLELKRELDSRNAKAGASAGQSEADSRGEATSELNEEEPVRHETSGLARPGGESEDAKNHSTSLREDLCEEPDNNSDAGNPKLTDAAAATEGAQLTVQQAPEGSAESVPNAIEGKAKPSGPGVPDSSTESIHHADLLEHRKSTAIGALVVLFALLMVFLAGYWVAKNSGQSAPSVSGRTADTQFSERAGEKSFISSPVAEQGARDKPVEGHDDNAGSSPDQEKSNVRPSGLDESGLQSPPLEDAPAFHRRAIDQFVPLADCFLEEIRSNRWIDIVEEDVAIGRKLFDGFIRKDVNAEPGTATAVFGLYQEYAKVTCVVGAPDDRLDEIESKEQTEVVFEADGQIIKRLRIVKGDATQVELPVKGVKALFITLHSPIVIADAKAWR